MTKKSIKKKPFTTIPLEVFSNPNIKAADIAVLGALCKYANNKTRKCWPTMKTLEEDVKMSRQTISKCISRLEDNNFIDIRHKYIGKKTQYIYTILDTEKEINEEDISEKVKELDENSSNDKKSDVKNFNNDKETNVKNLNINYTTLNKNYTKHNTLSIDRGETSFTQQRQSTLIDVPKPLEKPKYKKKTRKEQSLEKIDKAKKGLIPWSLVTFRDFTFYYIDRHNELMERDIKMNIYESVGIIRDCLIKSFSIPTNEVCTHIDRLLEVYSDSPQSWGYLSFNMIRSNHPMMKDLMMRVQLDIQSEKEPEVDEEKEKELREWKWKMDNIDELSADEIF